MVLCPLVLGNGVSLLCVLPCGTMPPRVEYRLTARGQSLMPHVSALIGWALENFDIAPNKPILFKTECFKS